MTYVGKEVNQYNNEDSDLTIREIMQEFLDYVLKSEDECMPKEKIKLVVSDFLSDNNINPIEWIKEDEQNLLEKWNKSVSQW